MEEGIKEVTQGFFAAHLDRLGTWWDNRRRKQRLKAMLRDSRYTFRSMKQLSEGIHCDRETTARLLLAIRARKSENSDEWTLNG